MSAIGECSVCSEPLEIQLATLPCGHIFHFECIDRWIKISGNCPKCRKVYKVEEIIKLFAESPLEINGENDNDFRDLYKQLNKIVLSNKKLVQLHQDDYNTIEVYNKKWQEACFEREKSLLRAAQAELDLEESKKEYKEMEQQYQVKIKSLEDHLQQIKDQCRRTYELATAIQTPIGLTIDNPGTSNATSMANTNLKSLFLIHFGGHTIYMKINKVGILIKPNENNLQNIMTKIMKNIEICIQCDIELVKTLNQQIKVTHHITSMELKDNVIQELSQAGLKFFHCIQKDKNGEFFIQNNQWKIKRINYSWAIYSPNFLNIFYLSQHYLPRLDWQKLLEEVDKSERFHIAIFNFCYIKHLTFELIFGLFKACRAENIILFNTEDADKNDFLGNMPENLNSTEKVILKNITFLTPNVNWKLNQL